MMCLDCKFVKVLRDNHADTHSICVCRESDHFLEAVSLAFDGCEQKEKDEEDEEDGAGNG